MKSNQIDHIGHMEACYEVGIFDISGKQEWGLRIIGKWDLQDVDGYRTREDAELARKLASNYGFPPLEIVRRVDGCWVNCW